MPYFRSLLHVHEYLPQWRTLPLCPDYCFLVSNRVYIQHPTFNKLHTGVFKADSDESLTLKVTASGKKYVKLKGD